MKKKQIVPIFIVFLFTFFSLGTAEGAGWAPGFACMQPVLTVSSPSPSATVRCGEYIEVSGSFRYNSCLNTPSTLTINGVTVKHLGQGYSGPVSGNFTVGYTIPADARGAFNVPLRWTYDQGNCGNIYPTGTKNALVNVSCGVPGACGWANALVFDGDIDGNGACSSGNSAGWGWDPNRYGWYWYCAGTEGEANSGWCSANRVLHGACGTIHGTDQQWPSSGSWCSAGTHSGAIDGIWNQKGDRRSGNIWTWNCTGKNGGGTASCQFVHRCPTGQILDNGTCRMPICLANPAVGVSVNNTAPVNASALSVDELPHGLKLADDYITTLIADPNRRTELNTAAGCEYSCNDGFKIGPKTATAESNSAGTFAKITHGGGGYTTAPSVQVTGGSCTTRPTAVAIINASGSLSALTLTGAVNCTVAPTLTVSAPTDTVTRCIATQCIGFAKPDNATYCSGDTTLAGHDDEMNTRRADSSGCTSNAKCEWYCPAATPFYCESANTCVTSQNQCGQTNTCKTSAPSEIKKELDYPFIQCDAINTTDTHFRYKIEKTSGLGATPTSTSTNPNLTVTKLLAKADAGGNCPSNPSAYVANLTDIVANDKLCVRLVYNNATTGAVSNALITDSIPTGFTRITNSTKNCLTPTGSSELCSDATDMGGAIGNNGWSGNNFSLTPHAGFYAIPTNKTTGDKMEMARKRYLLGCTVQSRNSLTGSEITHTQVIGGVNTSPGFTSIANNWSTTITPVPTNTQCAQLFGYSGTNLWNNTNFGYQPLEIEILGRKNLLICNVEAANASNFSYKVYTPTVAVNSNPGFTNKESGWPSNLNPYPTNTQCAQLSGFNAGVFPYPSAVNNTGGSNQPMQTDLTQGRFLLHCFTQGDNNMQYVPLATITNVSNATLQTNQQCFQLAGHPAATNAVQNTPGGDNSPYVTDLLDTTNGKGYIQYMVEATATPSNLALPSATLAGTTTTPDTSSANATINVTPNSATGTPYTSTNSFAVGTQVLHTATPFTEGTYKVECFYGTASNVPVDAAATPHACTKNINVKAANDSTAQGCSRILAYRDSTLSNEMASPGGFEASFRCGSRLPVTETVTNPYQFRFGTNPIANLQYDSIISEFFNGLGIGPVSTQTQNYDIPNNNTDISCAMKVGGGYSTNNACKTTTCVGATCSLPQTFSVVNSQNVTCTPDASSEYDIGCNSAADDTTRKFCAKWFKDAFDNRPNKSVSDFQTYFTFGGAHALIDCTQYTANDPRFGGLNMYENFVCTTTLPNGEKVEIFGAEKKPDNSIGAIAALQTTAYTVKRDTDKPVLSALKFYSGSTVSESTYIADQSRWQKSPVTAAVTCTNTPFSDGNYCVCAPHVAAVSTVAGVPGTTTPDLWSPGIPDATVGADIMRYTRTITTSLNGATVAVRDTAGNISPDARTISIGVDTVAPTVNITTTGTAPSLAVTITATDNTGGSGIWKDNIQTQTYLATATVPTFDDKCNLTSADSLLYETYSATGTPLALTKSTATPITLNTSTHKLAYCIQDNAGNITKGFYPSVPVACFSSTNLPTVPGTTPSAIPSIATYVAPLIARIAPATGVGQFGYGMSTDATNANCFRGIITSNVTRLISNQYNASTASTVDWSAPAKVKSNPAISNTNGYYYHTAMTPNLLTITSSPTGTGPKVVYAEGADIQINADINYRDSSTTTNSNTLLIIIAKRATSGANPAGGNIYINPNVKHIDAILITDGAIMNGVNGVTRDYITNPDDLINRLTINGRIYSMNTRGGSIDSSILTSNNLGMITTNTGKVFANNASLTTNATPAQAAAQDLERFRVINDDGNTQCTLFLNYKTLPINTLPPILQRPSGYAGGGCGF